MNDQEIEKLIKQLEEDLALAKGFYALMKRRKGETASLVRIPAQQSLIAPITSGSYGSAKQSVLEAISKCPPLYTINDVESKLVEAGKPMTRLALQQAMSRLSKRGDIKVKTPNKGRTPTVYEKA